MTKKTKFRPPYVGEDGAFFAPAIEQIPTNIKSLQHACCVCEKPFAPFGIGYPETTQWFCRKHVGEVMPEVVENSDRNKLNEVRRRTVRAAKLWLDLHTACANGDAEGARSIWPRIREVSVEASDILKSVSTENHNG